MDSVLPRILAVILSLALVVFSILYIIRSFKAFNAVLEMNKKMDDIIYLLRHKE